MDKNFLVQQLLAKLRAVAQVASKMAADSRTEAKTGAARAVNLAKGTGLRNEVAIAHVEALEQFRPKPLRKGEPIGLGAIVEVEDDEGGRSLFLAPAGAGEELTGPDGDGIFQVVTPSSPIGRALMGKKVGDVVEAMVKNDPREWTITWAT